ncbi:hypothetical protein R3P38DRAFT_3216972 [Favolaschia claudopus]|uniref:Uncharacterized protein n=1 Tax=Favolaschia claudopus TaxID=2862362 RepID=A0AAW0A692_9AGAR
MFLICYRHPLSPSPTSFSFLSPPFPRSPFSLSTPPPAVLSPELYASERGFGRRQANPALRLTSTHQHLHPASLVTARAPRSGAHSVDYIDFVPASSQHIFTGDFAAGRQKSPAKLKPTRFLRASRALELVKDAPRSGARIFAGDFAAGRQKLPSILKAAPPPASPAVQLVDGAPRSGAYSFEYIEIVPASETSVIHGDFATSKQKPPLQTQSDVITSYVARRSGANALIYRSRASNLTQVEFPAFSGIRFFAVRRATLVKWTNQSLPAPRLPRFSKANIKIGNSRFRRPPTADFVREVVQFSDSSFRVPMNLNFNIVRFEA